MIPDTHNPPAGWGIQPVAFTLGAAQVSSYALFVVLGLVAAIVVYYLNVRRESVGSDGLYIALGAAIGGVLGAKLPVWIANAGRIAAEPGNAGLLLSGRTVVGGIIGGVLGVWLVKRRLGITRRLGNHLVGPLCLGIAFGRVGCFLAGCCYGTATALPWGVDFGDGITRHPTQLYEAALMLVAFAVAQLVRDRFAPGMLFRWFMVGYFGWRFLVEFVRVHPEWVMGLTSYQVTALAIVLLYLFRDPVRVAIGPLRRSA